jgi:hypothetical protein
MMFKVHDIKLPFRISSGARTRNTGGLDRAIANGRLHPHESGTYVRFTEAVGALFG